MQLLREESSKMGATSQDNAMTVTRTRQNVGGSEVFVDSDTLQDDRSGIPLASIDYDILNDVDQLIDSWIDMLYYIILCYGYVVLVSLTFL